jgi:hypothetical protein
MWLHTQALESFKWICQLQWTVQRANPVNSSQKGQHSVYKMWYSVTKKDAFPSNWALTASIELNTGSTIWVYIKAKFCELRRWWHLRLKAALFVISGFRSEVAENFALLGHYAASRGNFLPMFRDNLSGLIFRVYPTGFPKTSRGNYHY